MIVSTVLPENKWSLPAWQWPRAAYIHVPFCAHHCGYCDFAIAVGQQNQMELYLDALEMELRTLQEPSPVDTLFIGGGTPTLLAPRQLDRLFEMLNHWLPLKNQGELSIEANPGTLDGERIGVLVAQGVTRVSLGSQSFQTRLLKVLERDHVPEDVIRAMEALRKVIPQVSLDLIFGAPGQTESEWLDDLRKALSLEPDHISTYGLTYEKGTPLWKQRKRGEVVPIDEAAELNLYSLGIDTLEAAGFEQYEISNFAKINSDKTSKRSRHNQVYWANEAYFGFGMGAARYVLGRRELNTRDLSTYLRRMLSGENPTFQSEMLEPFERARETMAVQLRRCEGIDRAAFKAQTGHDLEAIAGAQLDALVEVGLLQEDGDRVFLTRKGKYVADGVIEKLLRGCLN